MSWYKAGKVTSVAGTNVITGTGTLWSNPIFGIAPGQMILVPGAGQVVIYEILAVDSDTKIRTVSNMASSITNSDYAIVTTVSNSMSDLARRTAVQLALYQGLLEDWQLITTGTGDVTIIAPDGSTVVIPSLAKISQDLSNKVNQSQLSGMGIGLPTLVGLTSLDWQQQDFLTGANYIGSNDVWTNTPVGVSYNAGTGVSITVDYISSNSTRMGLTLVSDTTLASNFKVYKILSVGAKGSRVFTVREELTSANPVPITGGGTGSNTLTSAQSALGIVTNAFNESEVKNTPWLSLTIGSGWTGGVTYRKVLGMLQIKFNLSAAGAANGSTVATLPVGYRPINNNSVLPFGQRDAPSGLYPMRFLIQGGTGAILVGSLSGAGEVSGTFLVPFE
ncbi:putative phage tail protein [Yersinia frederiksenii]|uniref:hypothetical protein n=1 Tax=Yersinia enterocolitica TaxID=630 RepID=UPI0005E2E080|nr:putative phage tail protein [Yersinia frederiksenii]